MWRIILNVLGIIGLVLALFVVTKMLSVTHEDYYGNRDHYLYDVGNAAPEVRKEIEDQLELFQDGYTARDTSVIDSYMDQLFSKENVLILGTMPNEIYSGFAEATDLVQSDWLYWGDVRFLMEQPIFLQQTAWPGSPPSERCNLICPGSWFFRFGSPEFW